MSRRPPPAPGETVLLFALQRQALNQQQTNVLVFPVAALPAKSSTPHALPAFSAPQAPLRASVALRADAACPPSAPPMTGRTRFAGGLTGEKITPQQTQ